MKKKYFLSLNAKIFLFLFLSFSGICTLFLLTFMNSYVNQLEQESMLVRKKAETVYELYNENEQLRKIVSQIQEEQELSEKDFFTRLWAEQDYDIDFTLKPQSQRSLEMRKEIMKDIKDARKRDNKFHMLGYFVLSAFLLVFFILELLWLIVRRWILKPIERLLEATHKISSGDLDFRVSVSPKISRSDELDILARDFNKMADDIQKNIQKIQENEKFLQDMIDNIPDGIRVFDEKYNIILTNSAYDRINQSLKGKENKKCFEYYRNSCPCSAEQHPCTLALLRQNPDKPINVIQRYTDEDGREKFVEVSAAATHHKTEEGDVLWVIELVRPLDKTILFSHQQKLSAVGMLASSVAHEMRNPLGSVKLILENLLDKMESKDQPPKDLKHYLSVVYDQIDMCINVTSRLLKLSRKPEKTNKPVDMNEVVSETASLLEYEAKKTGIEITVQESEKPVVISAADAEMRMVVVNLMQNAFHAMPNGGKMDIKIYAEDKKVLLDFSDTGTGIEPENLTRIFEPFFSKRADREKQEGVGLGLSIVKTIIENSGGIISVESTVGKGTTFHLSFDAMSK
ncbi:MAG: HAMP domain-containing protein [Alphaproteobacteria bacterium]|nr:HAMP domain-containing protein [Alphaproteobacteria bacterium]MBO4643517.1 HAMP domain-containing protein [Alphaproteobacteria bacterium]